MHIWEFNGAKILTTDDIGKLSYGQILEYTKKTEQGWMNGLYSEGILWRCHAFGGTLLVWSGSNCPLTNPLTLLGTSLVAVTVPSSTWLHIPLGGASAMECMPGWCCSTSSPVVEKPLWLNHLPVLSVFIVNISVRFPNSPQDVLFWKLTRSTTPFSCLTSFLARSCRCSLTWVWSNSLKTKLGA